MNMHRTTWFMLHRLGHERRENAMAEGRFSNRPLEQEHAVGEIERVAVRKIDLHLSRADFMHQRFDAEMRGLAETRKLLEERIEFVDGVDRERLAARFVTPRAAEWRAQRFMRILVLRDQVELHLRRDHGAPAFFLIELQYAPQHRAR
jgi:hypothetical protein